MFVVVFAVVGCSDDDDDDNNNDVIHHPSADEWIGKWEWKNDSTLASLIEDDDGWDNEGTSHLIFANNGTFFWEIIVSGSREIGPGLTQTVGMDVLFKGTYVVDGGRFSLVLESVNVEYTPEDLPGLEALEEEAEADFGTELIGSGTWALEGDVMTLTPDEDILILHKVIGSVDWRGYRSSEDRSRGARGGRGVGCKIEDEALGA